MPEICYVPRNFNDVSETIIFQARDICADFAGQGYDLTLRQLYYQFVAGDLFPDDWTWAQTTTGKWVRHAEGTKNADPNYKRLGSIINDARLAGALDWDYIVDRTRNLKGVGSADWPTWDSPEQIIENAARGFIMDKWADQDTRIEVWIEKDALIGILETACNPMQVPYFSCRGYTSQSELWGAAQRLGQYIENGQNVVILHLGDHDPSGIDMTRDIEARLSMFISQDLGYFQPDAKATVDSYIGALDELLVERIALNMDQIRQYNPPPNPAKLSDARGAKYVETYGSSSWELDALSPSVLATLIQRSVRNHRHDDRWADSVKIEKDDGAVLQETTKRWADVKQFLTDSDGSASR